MSYMFNTHWDRLTRSEMASWCIANTKFCGICTHNQNTSNKDTRM